MTTRAKLKSIARDVVQDKGVRTLTLRDLGEAAGIKSSSVAYHFGSKEALLREITGDYIAGIMEAVEVAEATIPSGLDRMLALFDQFEQLGKADRLCLCGVMAASLHDVDKETASMVRRFFRDLETWFARQIQEASSPQIGRTEAKERARTLVAGAQGALLLDKADGKSTHLRAVRHTLTSLVRP